MGNLTTLEDFRPIREQRRAAGQMLPLTNGYFDLLHVELVTTPQPEIYDKGGDWDVNDLPEAPAVRAYGGRIELIELVPGQSTREIITTIVERYGRGT